ncbi:molybdenum cofactor synthesis domain [Rubrobacter radiotolerans]|uniref:Molybdopterin molybdenumtransferase n=1 Tax=Rubrobacter radiotolerans TaxID=42256 RepID=A0A023X0K6_RUBRA|nr:gephyrin-like molybdotransferase Glp [Rubrobacter radiotolerans]AHY45535.1 molybdenum cofactor synthesis domain [Rubrobacter radiotolerans]MDX5892948.1 molybdopterin molybdotransferase MoeA [Rubrobacter radiotolerans]SMC02795.1 molybdopterin molybdochelatase [Rubrobacter radiotolerans DSM 5868]
MQLFEKLIEYAEARRLVLENLPGMPAVRLPLAEARGLALAEDLRARFDSPPFDNSAVDGYAVRARDTGEGVSLEVIDEAPAGRPSERTVGEGEAVKIFTGGVVPAGADAVVMVEDTSGWSGEEGGTVRLKKAVPEGNNIRRSGEDVRPGEVILRSGVEVGPYEIALAASQGYAELPVLRRPRVVVLSTGTELVEPGSRELSAGEIFDSNSYALVAQAEEAGAEARRLYAASDDAEVLRAAVEEALTESDLVVTSGGVSVGEKDLVKSTLEDLGVEQVFWGVRFKPGKPLFFGAREDARFFGLPGNPVSAMVCFELFVRPALMRMMGRTDHRRPKVEVYFEEETTNRFGRMHAVRVSLERTEKGLLARSVGAQGSGLITSLTKADAIAMIGPEARVPAGEPVEAVVLRDF